MKMIKVIVQHNNKPQSVMLPALHVLQKPTNVRMDGLIEALRIQVLENNSQIAAIENLLKEIFAQTKAVEEPAPVVEERKSLRPTNEALF